VSIHRIAQVWNEAHKEFIERVKSRAPPQELHVDDGDDDDGDGRMRTDDDHTNTDKSNTTSETSN
jgi:hypothetical protein